MNERTELRDKIGKLLLGLCMVLFLLPMTSVTALATSTTHKIQLGDVSTDNGTVTIESGTGSEILSKSGTTTTSSTYGANDTFKATFSPNTGYYFAAYVCAGANNNTTGYPTTTEDQVVEFTVNSILVLI